MSAAVKLTVLTNSELRSHRACGRRHHYAYRLLRRPLATSTPLSWGILWHTGMDGWWTAVATPEDRLTSGIVALRAAGYKDPHGLVTAEELLVAYTARWGDQVVELVTKEERFEVPLVNPETGHESRTYRIGGKFDGIVVVDGEKVVLEHKSTASDVEAGSLYWKKVQTLDTQVSTYIAGARASGYDVTACLYDVVRKIGLRPYKATPPESRKYLKGTTILYANQHENDETPEDFRLRVRAEIQEKPERYFARERIVRLDADINESAYDTWQQAKLLREAEIAGFAPRNPDACSQFGGCPYLPVCSHEASIDDDTLFRTAGVAHEELQDDA